VIVLDASALIALLDDHDVHHDWALQMFIDTVSEDLSISVLNFSEVLVHPVKAGRSKEFLESLHGLGLTVHGVDSEEALSLATMRATSGLRMPDVIAVNLALRFDAALATTDRSLGQAARDAAVRVLQPA
jgi:predicted nucleic acid-binding protein